MTRKDPSQTMIVFNNTPEKVPCCQIAAKTMSDVKVDLEILNQVD